MNANTNNQFSEIYDALDELISDDHEYDEFSSDEMILLGKMFELKRDLDDYYRHNNRSKLTRRESVRPIFESRNAANEILTDAKSIALKFNGARLSDIYDLCGVTGYDPVIANAKVISWDDLLDTKILKTPNGFIFRFPDPDFL